MAEKSEEVSIMDKLAEEAARSGIDLDEILDENESKEVKDESTEKKEVEKSEDKKEVVEKDTEDSSQEPEKEADKEETVDDSGLSDIEKEAMAKGWKPKSEFDDPGKRYKTAEEYLEMGSFFEKIDSQSKQIKNLEKNIKQLSGDFKKARETGYKQALADLEARKRAAVEEGDTLAYDVAQREVEKLQEEATTPKQPEIDPKEAELMEIVNDFKERNKEWYNADSYENLEMKRYADIVDVEIARSNPNIDPKEHVMLVELEVHKRFPDRFKEKDKPRTAPNPVMKGNKVDVKRTELPDVASLSPTQKQLYFDAKAGRVPGMTGEDYLKGLQDSYGAEL